MSWAVGGLFRFYVIGMLLGAWVIYLGWAVGDALFRREQRRYDQKHHEHERSEHPDWVEQQQGDGR